MQQPWRTTSAQSTFKYYLCKSGLTGEFSYDIWENPPPLLTHTTYAIDCYGYIPLDVTLLKLCTVLATGKTQQPQWVTRRIPTPFKDIIQAGMSN
jgi:hypothetical protein